jgi:hypothetical protein
MKPTNLKQIPGKLFHRCQVEGMDLALLFIVIAFTSLVVDPTLAVGAVIPTPCFL